MELISITELQDAVKQCRSRAISFEGSGSYLISGEELTIIYAALQELIELKKPLSNEWLENLLSNRIKEDFIKEYRAFRIIVEKDVDVAFLKKSKRASQYNNFMSGTIHGFLTQEEFNSLKEAGL